MTSPHEPARPEASPTPSRPLGCPSSHVCLASDTFPEGGTSRGVRVRLALAVAPLALVLCGLAARLVQLHTLEHERWEEAGLRQRRSLEKRMAPRGNLRAGGETLAFSIQRPTVIADLRLLQDPHEAAAKLAPILERDEDQLAAAMTRPDRRVVYLARHVEPAVERQVRELELKGIGFEDGFRRVYPQSNLACHVVGFAGTDGGLEGLELKLDALLRGIPGFRVYERDAARRALSRGEGEGYTPSVRQPKPGLDVDLTLHPGIQFVAERELARIMEAFRPKGATAVVLDCRTGEILALAVQPSFDPNAPADAPAAARRNRAVTDVYEPGSTFKTFVAAVALDRGLYARHSRFDCENGAWRLGYRTLHDAHAYGMLSFDEVLIKSSNIGAAKMGLRLGRDGVWDAVKVFGFGEPLGCDLPGELGGIVRPKQLWTRDSLYSIPMGQEIACTPLQLAAAYAAMVNGGVLLRPQIVKRIRGAHDETLYEMQPAALRRAIGPQASAAMREILQRVVVEGTGRQAWCPEYAIGGKTGTAQKVENGRYSHEKYVGSFCGFAPAEAPRLVCLVTVDEPDKALGYYGGTVAAPAVMDILRRGLHAIGVAPRSPGEQKAARQAFQRRRM